MAKIPMTSGFTVIPEGTYIFQITKVDYNADFGSLLIYLETKDGQKHRERFSLKNKDDEYNQGALNAFSYFAKTVLNDFQKEEVDPLELVGHFIKAEVKHTVVESNRDTNKTMTFANLGQKEVALSFDDDDPSADTSDLMDILNI